MTTLYTTYITTTGEIIGNFLTPIPTPPELNVGESIIDGWFSLNDYYIDLNSTTPTLKPAYPIIQNDNSFVNIPPGTTVFIPPAANTGIGGVTTEINDGSLIVNYNYPGTYLILFRNFKFIDQSYEVIVT